MIIEGHIGTGDERTIIIDKKDVKLFYDLFANSSLSDFSFHTNINNPSGNIISGDSQGRRLDLLIIVKDYEKRLVIIDEDNTKNLPKKYEMNTKNKYKSFDDFSKHFKTWIEEIQKTKGFNDLGNTNITIVYKENN